MYVCLCKTTDSTSDPATSNGMHTKREPQGITRRYLKRCISKYHPIIFQPHKRRAKRILKGTHDRPAKGSKCKADRPEKARQEKTDTNKAPLPSPPTLSPPHSARYRLIFCIIAFTASSALSSPFIHLRVSSNTV